jgi:diguanylate cyclase (GGDEF)-like protein
MPMYRYVPVLPVVLLLVALVVVSFSLLVRRVRTQRRALDVALRQASRDDLTGVLTRSAFLPLLDQWLGHVELRGPVALLVVDLDDFGVVNKRAGHQEGDRVLARAAVRLQGAVAGAIALARLGGDEFLVLAPADHAVAIAERIAADMARTPVAGHAVGASIGIALGPEHGDTSERLLAAADAALRVAKRSGKGRVSVSASAVLPGAERAALRDRVEALWLEDRIRIAVQPIVDLTTGTARVYEALARFDVPDGDSPLLWFAAADEVGLRTELELHCLRAALALFPQRPLGTALAVNASPRLLARAAARDALAAVGDLEGLIVEITEDEIVEDYDRLLARLDPLLRRGLALAVDDMGAGHATMRHVTALRPRYLKLDRSLVRGIDGDPAQLALVDALLGYAQRTDAVLVAEGVEHAGELETLDRLGVPLAQGFLLGRPGAPWPRRPRAPAIRAARDHGDPAIVVLPRETTAEEAHRRFAARPELQAAVVVDADHRVIGLLTRHRMLAALGHRFGFSLYGTKSVMAIADRRCLLVGEGLAHARLVARAMGRDIATRYDPVLVVDELGRLVHHVTIQGLLEQRLDAVGADRRAA